MELAVGRRYGQQRCGSVRVRSKAAAPFSFARAAVLGLLYLVCYWLGRIAGAACRLVLWCVAAAVKGFQDAF